MSLTVHVKKELFHIHNKGYFFISGLSLLESKEDLFQDWKRRFWTSYKVCVFTEMFLKRGYIYFFVVKCLCFFLFCSDWSCVLVSHAGNISFQISM